MQERQYIVGASILALGLIVSTLIGGMTWKAVRSFDNALSVTGSAKKQVTADTVKWTVSIERNVLGKEQVQVGYKQLASDFVAVKKELVGSGIPETAITSNAVFISESGYYDPSRFPGSPVPYRVTQNITVQSGDVEKVTALAKNLAPLLSQGVFINTIGLEYYYSKLPELRVSLLSDAIKDAQARAGQIASASGRTVGTLKSASSGVVQVLPVNSGDVSDYGSYDTSNIEKEVFVTVRASFILD